MRNKNNIVTKMTKLHSIQSEFKLQHITLTDYYIIVMDTNLDDQ